MLWFSCCRWSSRSRDRPECKHVYHYALAMTRNGLLIAAGIIGIIRGLLGTFIGLSNLSVLDAYNELVPGIGAPLVFELVLSVAILLASIWVIVKANDHRSASMIKAWGVLVIVAGVIDMVWTIALLGTAPGALGSSFGSVVALTLIGVLLIAGANGLSRRAETSSVPEL